MAKKAATTKAAIAVESKPDVAAAPPVPRPRLHKLTVSNFRCIGSTPFEIELDDIVVLVGPNNCGKTTFLQAVSTWAFTYDYWAKRVPDKNPRQAFQKVPIARQAWTYSRSRWAMNSARARRATGGQETTAIALITLTSDGRKIAMMTTASTKEGIVRKKSVTRISSASTHFP